ncbi:flagellar biosynthesis anti-sigma factor FlgM [Lentibacillus lipolyticus]|nr:flagellar biosynthesis anti-sigma factor FlgM [Lentibacillus lipolyticus]
MKIHGPNQTNFNPYKNRLPKQMDDSKGINKKDQLEISDEAKQMLKNDKTDTKRASYVQEIKNAVKEGTYRVDHEKAAQRMMNYWSANGKGGD